jgi:predicted GNAT family acetyltransferase
VDDPPAREADPPYLAAVELDGEVVGCAFRTPPMKVGITRMPRDAIPALIDHIESRFDSIPGVLGPEPEAGVFASVWSGRRRGGARPGMRLGIYQLEKVRRPESVPPGRLRAATPDDLELATAWGTTFIQQVAIESRDIGKSLAAKIDAGALWFWDDGQPRSMAAEGGRTRHGSRIGWVYTPKDWRGRGYASACVADASQRVLDAGRRFCFLYTDLSNPTSNALYQRIGYERVCDVIDYWFDEKAP